MNANTLKNKGKKPGALSPSQELKQYHALFKTLPDIIYKIDAFGYFIYISEAITDLGYTPDELVGKHFKEIIHPHDINAISREAVLPLYKGEKTGDASAPKLFDERRTGSRATRRLVVRFVSKYLKDQVKSLMTDEDENQFYGEVHSYGDYFDRLLRRMQEPKRSGSDGVLYGEISSTGHYSRKSKGSMEKFAGTVGIIRNITEHVILGKQKARLEEQLQHSMKVEAIGQMTVGIIHDLNNVLNNCLCSAELIQEKLPSGDDGPDPQMHQIVASMINGINNGTKLIRTVLDFTRKTQSKVSVLNGHTLISDAMHLLSFTIENNVSITHDFRAENPYFTGDPVQIQNALVNTAINARDAMERGGRLAFSTENRFIDSPLSLPARQKNAIGEYLVISITDSGCGMDETIQRRLFEPFFTTKPPGKGTGLGLANVARVMRNHNGFVDVVSAPGKGSTFKFYLPVTMAGETAPKTDAMTGVVSSAPVYINARVLVIDNDATICEILKYVLQNAGCQVTTNTNPLKAIEAYRKHADDFDLVLIDMLMPECNGFECFRRLKELHPSIKALLVSGLNELVDEKRLSEIGILGSITKPFNIRSLIQTVAKTAGKSLP
ncbi:MAG: response regulator [Chitinivibrionales bacterium]